MTEIPRTHRTTWLVVFALLGAATAVAAIVRPMLQDDIEGVPGIERSALYERTLETLRSCQQATRPALAEYCRTQADFIRRFPECRDECRELAGRFAAQPSR